MPRSKRRDEACRSVYRTSRVFDIMAERGLQQKWLAEACECSEAAISRFRNGSRGYPLWFVVRCTTLFEMSHDELFSDPLPRPTFHYAPAKAAPKTLDNPGWFWARTRRTNPRGCWEWTGTTNAELGYGVVYLTGDSGVNHYAHRVAYEIANGAITNDLHVLHECDNRICVNPAHLFLGTMLDNIRDRDAKGRQAKGTQVPAAKLVEDDIPLIRARLQHEPIQSIADDYRMSYTAILAIRDGRTWKHVPLETEASNGRAA